MKRASRTHVPSNRHNDLRPLFDTALNRVLSELPARMADLFQNLHERKLLSVHDLKGRVQEYMKGVEESGETVEFLDLATARRVFATCLGLLGEISSETSEADRRLTQAAVLYFLEIEDDDSDTHSPIGFDDDMTVVAVVAREVGREDLHK